MGAIPGDVVRRTLTAKGPTAAEVAAAKREALLAKKREAEAKRRARIKATKAA